MNARRSPAIHAIFSALLVAVVFAVTGSASSGEQHGTWTWQIPGSAPKTLAVAQLGSDRVALTAVSDQSGEVTLLVTSDGTEIQAIPAGSLTSAPLVSFLVTGTSGATSLVGVARGDVAQVLLFAGSSARELP